MSEEGRSSAPAKKHLLTPVENFLLSGTAALISKTAAAPIERVKLMVQNQGEMLKSGALDRPYTGVADCFSRIYKEEGITPFWRGNLPNCLRYFPTQALNFMFKDIFKQMFKFDKKDSYWLKFYKNIMSGAAAGSVSLVFVYSLDYCRTKLANDIKGAKKGGQREFNGMFDVYSKTWQTDGIVGLYRGFVISCVGIAIYRGFYFGLYDSLKPIIIGEQSNFLLDFSLGYTITVAAGLLSYPVDTIRRRMMMTSGQKVKYKGSIDCTVQILQKEGVKALFHGAGANILRGMAGAGVLSGFDKFKEIYIYLRFGGK